MLWLLTVFKYNNPVCGPQPGSTRQDQIAWVYSRLYLPDFYEYTDIRVIVKLSNTTFSTQPIMKQITTVYFPRLSFQNPAYLSMDQSIIEENEPIHRKPAGMLQGEGAVTALT